jgi:hypothetical protein
MSHEWTSVSEPKTSAQQCALRPCRSYTSLLLRRQRYGRFDQGRRHAAASSAIQIRPSSSRNASRRRRRCSASSRRPNASPAPLGAGNSYLMRDIFWPPQMPSDETLDVADITEIRRLLPHRFPFLLIDRVLGTALSASLLGILIYH